MDCGGRGLRAVRSMKVMPSSASWSRSMLTGLNAACSAKAAALASAIMSWVEGRRMSSGSS